MQESVSDSLTQGRERTIAQCRRRLLENIAIE
jgi:hypothetical protein